jgi:DNA invertase Pin-like site-specific DNA recombinase
MPEAATLPALADELKAVRLLREGGMDADQIARALRRSRATVYRRLDQIDRLRAELPARPARA